MRNPICHIDGNLIFARSTSDIWAIYQVECESYPGLTLSRQIEAMQRLYYFAYRIEAPFWIGRVQRTWSVDDYAVSAQDTVNTKTGHPDLFGEYLAEQYTHLSRHAIYRPELYLAVRLQDLDESLASIVGAGGVSDVLAALGRYFGMAGPRALSRERLARIYDAEARVRRRVLSFLDAWPAATDRVEWLIRRAYTRGLGEPYCDGHTKPRALTGGVALKPGAHEISFSREGTEPGSTRVNVLKDDTTILIPFAERVPATDVKPAGWAIRVLRLKQREPEGGQHATLVSVSQTPEIRVEVGDTRGRWSPVFVKRLALATTPLDYKRGYVPLRTKDSALESIPIGGQGNYVVLLYDDAAGALKSLTFRDFKYLSAD